MRLVVDTNIIFSALIRDSVTRHILLHIEAELLTVGFTYSELQKYKMEILKKSQASEEAVEIILQKIMAKINIVDDSLINLKFKDAYCIMKAIDIKDTPFLAAALATKSDIWSDDKHFEKQNKVKVWKTKDIVVLL
jgi:predicted nucleic acid-binding protein